MQSEGDVKEEMTIYKVRREAAGETWWLDLGLPADTLILDFGVPELCGNKFPLLCVTAALANSHR